MLSILVKKVSTIGAPSVVKQQLWESMYGNLTMHAILQTTVIAELQDPQGLLLVDSLPLSVLISICEKSPYLQESSIMARLFTNLGNSLLIAVKNSLHNPIRALDSLGIFDQLLLRHFRPQINNATDVDRFLEPIVWVVTGVNAQVSVSRTQYGRTDVAMKDTLLAVPWCFLYLLRIYLHNVELSTLTGAESHIASVWWSKVSQALTKKVFENPALQVMFQQSLEVFTSPGKSSFFDVLSVLEGRKDVIGSSLPAMYATLSGALGEALHRLNFAKYSSNYAPNAREHTVTSCVEKCIEVLPQQTTTSSQIGICYVSYSYMKASLDNFLLYMREEKYVMPRCLLGLFGALGRTDVEHLHQHVAQYLEDMIILKTAIQDHLSKTIEDIHDADVPVKDLDVIAKNMDDIKSTCQALSIQLDKLMTLDIDLLVGNYQIALQDAKELNKVILFLHQRNLCPRFAELRDALDNNGNNSVTVKGMLETVLAVSSKLGLDDFNVLRALRAFAGNSDLFVHHFGKVEMKVQLSEQEAKQEVIGRTRHALDNLALLVSNENIRIEDFFAADIAGLVSELQRTGQGHSHRQRKMEHELEAIAQFFGSEKNSKGQTVGKLATSLERLNAAFHLVKLKEILPAFLLAMKELKLGHLLDGNTSNLVSLLLKELSDNFFIKDGPGIRTRLDSALSGLRQIDLVIISKLASSEELSAGLMLQIFARFSSESAFDQALEHAQNQASGNPVAGKLLLKLRGLRTVLRPFWNNSYAGSLQFLTDHMLKEVRVVSGHGGELLCPTLEELTNVIEHWPECEICFRDGGSSSSGFGDIARLVQVYQRFGHFVSSLSAHPGGPYLSFTYNDKIGNQVLLSPQVLQEHVQWAVLGASGNDETHEAAADQKCLDQFIAAFGLAEKLQNLCLQLEASGHPDFQSLSCMPNMPLAQSCNCDALCQQLAALRAILDDWQFSVKLGCKESLRLCMLSQKARVHFFLALRGWGSLSTRLRSEAFLSYVLQCFPSHLSARNALDQATALALTEYQEQSSLFESDWKRAFSLLQHVETTLDAKIEVDSTLIGLIVRFELLGLSDFEVYCAVLSINMTENRGIMNLPTAVLWCSQESTSENIQDFLSAACSGVSASVYVIAVNRLLPRVREELLGGLQSKGLRSQVALIFTEQDGLDACQQYRLEIQASNVCNNQYLDNYRQAMWPVFSRPATLRQGEFCELSVCVVGGRTGTGKSFWINRQIFKLKKCMKLTVVVHEGFNIMDVIDQVEKGFADRENSNVVVVLHVVVTTVANLSLLQGFLHNLFYSGLLYDPKTGKAFACTERTKVVLYVELPSLAKTDTMSAWPEAGDVWQTKDHPYLVHLPCLQVCVLHKNFINIRSADRFYVVNNEKARFVAACLHIYRSNNNNVDAVSLPSLLENDEFVTSIGPNNCANILTDFFDNKQFSRSKRSRNNAILVMYDKFRVISSFQHQMHLEMELGGDSEEVFFVAKYCGKVTAYFELAIYESFCIAREDCSLGTSSVQLIIPSWDDTDDVLPVESQLEVLVISNTAGVTAQALAGLTVDMPSHTLIRTFNEVSPEELAKLRSLIAPLFGMRNSALMCRNLIDAGHLLTAESLAGVLHLHGRRSIRANVLYEGETGCGKTQTLKLYANLINANTSLFTNLKFQMLAVLRIIVDDTLSNSPLHVDDVFTTEDVAAFENAGKRILDIDVMSASTTKLVQSTMDWLALGPLDLINSIGALVCAYFCLVFQQFPLYSDGCDELIMSKFTECSNWISKHEDYKTKVLDICARAAHTDFLVGVGNVSAHVLQGSIWSNSPAEESTLQGLPALELFSDGDDLKLFMQGLLNCKSSSLYFRLLADEGLSAYKWREFIAEVSNAANRVSELSASAVVCVFIDECNTSGAFGIVCEAFAWHTIHGEPLPSNLFLVGAINPYRTTSLTIPAMQFTKSNIDVGYQKDEVEEDSLDYLAHIPYIVKPLPPCMESLVVRYPNLSQLAETMFLREYIQQHITIPASAYINEIVWERQMQHFSNFVVLLVSRAQEIVRSFRIQRMYMSIRNLIRTIQLLDWYLNFQVSTSSLEPDVQVNIFLPEVKHANFHGSGRKKLTMTHSIVMAVAVSYMLQLPSEGHVAAGKVLEDFRQRFLRELAVFCTGIDNDWADELFGKAGRSVNAFVQHWTAIVKGALEHLWSFAKIPKGLAKTDAVMEVFYANIIAAENRMSLLVSGPPGCGKTLSFNLACDNLRGPSHQHTLAFQQLKKATKFMYQCSRSSTGPEIASRFLEAKEHQKDLDSRQPGKHVCIVGLDEAGLPPENRQALKSIHDDLGKFLNDFMPCSA
ncbi:hypothetical protein EON65_09410 [archaeon]|nr:MAG: hypothetical protein EON65_09410 [archaeon]